LRANMERAFNDKIYSLAPLLSEEQALNAFRQYKRYDHRNRWFHALYSIDRIRRFCALHTDGAALHLRDIPEEEIESWHPQRTCAPRVENGHRFGGDLEIDAELYETLIASAGRQTVRDAAEWCGLSRETFLYRAEELEQRMMLCFCKY